LQFERLLLALRWPAGANATTAASEALAAAALVHAAALALILVAVLVLLALEARDWLLRKSALALEQAFS
jgi:hypothetical protein